MADRTEATISERLKALGFGHRSLSDIGRQVFHAETGDVIGTMDAFEAVRFLETQEPTS